jgi:methylthioribulose-1-phosphate dehydratase
MNTLNRLEVLKHLMAETIQHTYQRGWAPATSTNYSFRHPDDLQRVWISASGMDKQYFEAKDLLEIDLSGQPVGSTDLTPSAETALHTQLYALDAETQAVLHTHSLAGTLLSHQFAAAGELVFAGLELLKAIRGQSTHVSEVRLPIFANTQDIPALARDVAAHHSRQPLPYGYLIAGHGLYAWGRSISEAKRHLECYEFLLAMRLAELQIGGGALR